jgi:conjugative transposon TraN protein
MKALLHLLPLFLLSGFILKAQPDGRNEELHSLMPYKIQVTNKATTVIIFPFSIVDADCGINELRAEKIQGISNVIKIKSAIDNMPNTNLHVFTSDGKVYVFEVSWHPSPNITTYDLHESKLMQNEVLPILLTSSMNEKEVKSIVEKAKIEASFLRRTKRRFQISLTLQGIYQHEQLLIVKFNVNNHSRLSYQAGWARFYISDKKVAKRSSVQELSIMPIYADELPDISGDSSLQWMAVIPKTTIPDKKKLTFVLQEKNGGRHLTLTIKNRHLFKAIPIQ